MVKDGNFWKLSRHKHDPVYWWILVSCFGLPNEDVKQSNQNAEVGNNIEGIFNKIIKKFS